MSHLASWLTCSSWCCRNAEKILGYLNSNVLSRDLIPPHVNFSHLTTKDYAEMYNVIKTVKEGQFSSLGLDPCLLEDELDKVRGRGNTALPRTGRGQREQAHRESCVCLPGKHLLYVSRGGRERKVRCQCSPALR